MFRLEALNSHFHNVSWREAYLNSSRFENGALNECNFRYSELRATSFVKMQLVNVEFDDGHLAACDFQGLDLRGCSFLNSELVGTNFFGCPINKDAFDGANLEGARFGENTGLDHRGEDDFVRRGAIFPHKVRGLEPA
jgi:uncharacterized protein YjbI with pentapeptide repeats